MVNRIYPNQEFYLDRRPRSIVVTIFVTRRRLEELQNNKGHLIFMMDEEGFSACFCLSRPAAELLYIHGETTSPLPVTHLRLQLPRRPFYRTKLSFTLTTNQLQRIETQRFVVLISAINHTLTCCYGQPDDVRNQAFPRYRPPKDK